MLDNSNHKIRHVLSMVLLLSMLGACANNVTVKGTVPKPLVNKLPINAHLSYTDQLRNYTYNEVEKGRALKSLNFGEAQVSMFEGIFGQLLNLVGMDDANKDLTIEPEILDLQYTAPRETKLKLYEVWLKYRIKIVDVQEQKLADWTIKGYGKTPTGSLTSPASAFNAATNIALRDVGAQLSIGFAQQAAIKALLDEQIDTQSEPAQAIAQNSVTSEALSEDEPALEPTESEEQ